MGDAGKALIFVLFVLITLLNVIASLLVLHFTIFLLNIHFIYIRRKNVVLLKVKCILSNVFDFVQSKHIIDLNLIMLVANASLQHVMKIPFNKLVINQCSSCKIKIEVPEFNFPLQQLAMCSLNQNDKEIHIT